MLLVHCETTRNIIKLGMRRVRVSEGAAETWAAGQVGVKTGAMTSWPNPGKSGAGQLGECHGNGHGESAGRVGERGRCGMRGLLLALLLGAVRPALGLVCYSCTASLSSATDVSAQTAMRIFLEATYFLPAVHRYCAKEYDLEFKTVPTAQCNANDRCVKIFAEGSGAWGVLSGYRSASEAMTSIGGKRISFPTVKTQADIVPHK